MTYKDTTADFCDAIRTTWMTQIFNQNTNN